MKGLEIMKDIKKIIFPEKWVWYPPNANLTKETSCNLRRLSKASKDVWKTDSLSEKKNTYLFR